MLGCPGLRYVAMCVFCSYRHFVVRLTDLPTYIRTGDPDDLCYFPEDPGYHPHPCNVTFFEHPLTERFPQLQDPPLPPDTTEGIYVCMAGYV